MDNLESNSSDQYKRTQKISYQTFLQEQKIRLKLRYPFLTKDQINKKAKDLWNHMGVNEKQFYTKTVLKKSPPSVGKTSSKIPVTIPRLKKKQETKKKWQGFRNLENEIKAGYENDFMSDSPRNSLSKTVDEDLSWLTVENESDISTKNMNTFQKSRCQLNQKVPEIIQSTFHQPQGILKGRNVETTAEKCNQPRVSFSSENVEDDVYSYSDLTQNTYSQDSSDDEYSSKLLHRNEVEVFDFDGESEQNTLNEEEDTKTSENPNQLERKIKDDENKDITLHETFKMNKRKVRNNGDVSSNVLNLTSCETNDKQSIEKSDPLSGLKSCEVETDQNEINTPYTRSKASKQRKTKTLKKSLLSKTDDKDSEEKLNTFYDINESYGSKLGKVTQEKGDNTLKCPDTRFKEKHQNKTNTFKKPRLSGTEDLNENNLDMFSYSVEKPASKSSQIQDSDENMFKSPMTQTRTKATIKENKRKSRNIQSFQSPGIKSMKEQPEQYATPNTDINENIDKYTTPLMDETVQQLLLKDVKKAPKKKSHMQDNICEEPISASSDKQGFTTKKKARTSLIGRDELCNKSETLSGMMGPTGDATFCQDMIMKKLEEKMIDIENEEFSNDSNTNLVGKECVKKHQHQESKGDLIGRNKKHNRLESYLLKESSPFIPAGYSDSVDSSYSEESQLSKELIKDSQRTNQALVKALLKMKQIVAGADSPEVTSVGSSPKLLSPALSGISQLSDMSSETDNMKGNTCPIKLNLEKDNSKRMKQKKTQPDTNYATCSGVSLKTENKLNDISEDGILCQMFQENTSKVPQNIFYTRKRLISSYKNEGNDFTRMFSEDDPFL